MHGALHQSFSAFLANYNQYLLTTETPHSLLLKTTPVYIDPALSQMTK